MDREKVIKAIDICLGHGKCDDCGYQIKGGYSTMDCRKPMMRDALAMLKEQEVELSYRKAKAITHTATKLDDATCPSCGNVVGEKMRTGAVWQSVVQVRWDYCRFCGQKLDWESR